MKFILAVDRVFASTSGHSVEFVAGVPTFVPPAVRREVREIGAVPADDDDDGIAPAALVEPSDPDKRAADILAAFELMLGRNNRADFGANNTPRVPAVAAILGWKPTAQERDALWIRYQADGVNG